MQAAAVGAVLAKVPWSKVFEMAPVVVREAMELYEKATRMRRDRQQANNEQTDRLEGYYQHVDELQELVDQQVTVIARLGQVQVALMRWVKALAITSFIALVLAIAAFAIALTK